MPAVWDNAINPLYESAAVKNGRAFLYLFYTKTRIKYFQPCELENLNASPGGLFIQKAGASTIGNLPKAVQQLFGDSDTPHRHVPRREAVQAPDDPRKAPVQRRYGPLLPGSRRQPRPQLQQVRRQGRGADDGRRCLYQPPRCGAPPAPKKRISGKPSAAQYLFPLPVYSAIHRIVPTVLSHPVNTDAGMVAMWPLFAAALAAS